MRVKGFAWAFLVGGLVVDIAAKDSAAGRVGLVDKEFPCGVAAAALP
jgi:hypothetical protein